MNKIKDYFMSLRNVLYISHKNAAFPGIRF